MCDLHFWENSAVQIRGTTALARLSQQFMCSPGEPSPASVQETSFEPVQQTGECYVSSFLWSELHRRVRAIVDRNSNGGTQPAAKRKQFAKKRLERIV